VRLTPGKSAEPDPLEVERWVLRIAAADVSAGKPLSAEDRARVQVARRLAAARGGSGMSGAAAPDRDPFDPEILEQEADREPGASLPEAVTRRSALPPLPDKRLRRVSDPPLASSEWGAEAVDPPHGSRREVRR
jgi:hypothetical protein